MSMELGLGDWPPRADWGRIPKCPYCSATNIRRRAKHQKTCGADVCRAKLSLAGQRKAQAKKVALAVG